MSLWTLVKVVAALAVLGVMAFTGSLAYHILVKPLGGVFEKMIPNPKEVIGAQPDTDFAKMLDSAELPDIDPGEKAFQKAHELIALGDLSQAREKLAAIVNVFPGSSSAPVARRIVSEMNLDDVLATSHMEGKHLHVVKKGDAYFAIAKNYKTSLDMIMHLNGMTELRSIQPGDELVVMPLEFRMLIEPKREAVSLWAGGKFVAEFPIVHIEGAATIASQRSTIESKSGLADGKRVSPEAKGYRGSTKLIVLAKNSLQIRAFDEKEKERARGIYLSPPDMEELALLTRAGNEVEIRNPSR